MIAISPLVFSKPHGSSKLAGALENFFMPNEKSKAEISLDDFLDSLLESKTETENTFMMNYLSPENEIRSLEKAMLALHQTIEHHQQTPQ